VADVLASERVDVAHFHGGVVSPLAYKGARDAQHAGIPVVVTLHCIWSYATPFFWAVNKLTKWGQCPVVLSEVREVAVAPERRIEADRHRRTGEKGELKMGEKVGGRTGD
jgi:glycosyltransferase involved in cell wall biosynthesis